MRSQDMSGHVRRVQNGYFTTNPDVPLTLNKCFLYQNLTRTQAQHFHNMKSETEPKRSVKLFNMSVVLQKHTRTTFILPIGLLR